MSKCVCDINRLAEITTAFPIEGFAKYLTGGQKCVNWNIWAAYQLLTFEALNPLNRKVSAADLLRLLVFIYNFKSFLERADYNNIVIMIGQVPIYRVLPVFLILLVLNKNFYFLIFKRRELRDLSRKNPIYNSKIWRRKTAFDAFGRNRIKP